MHTYRRVCQERNRAIRKVRIDKLTAAAIRSLGAGSLRSKIDTRSGVGSQVPWSGLVKRQLLCNGSKQFLHVGGGLGRCLEEE